MGNKSSKSSDDGCIGNRRVRTIVLSLVLIAFFVFGLAYFEANKSYYAKLADTTDLPWFGQTCDTCEDLANAWLLVMIGAITCACATIAALLFFLIPGCDDKMGRIAGLALFLGGIAYIAGWIWIIKVERDQYGSLWEHYSDEWKRQIQSYWAAQFGEALLAGGAAFLLGMDCCWQMYDDESHRLGSNLGLLCAVSVLCMNCYYLQVCPTDDDDTILDSDYWCVERDGVAAIATGYLVLGISTAVYLFLYIFSCCTCDCKDKCIVRVLLACALVVGGIIAAIGYYDYSGGYDHAETDPDSNDYSGKMVAYYVGYTVLVAGLPIVWAMDIALDDVKKGDLSKPFF